MSEMPQIVKSRLARGRAAAESHPDANLLAAFSEAALPLTERQGVIEHLAICQDCRDVVALALPEDTVALQPREVEPRPAWRFLRWIPVAACIVVVGVAGLWQYNRQHAPVVAKFETISPISRQQPEAESTANVKAAPAQAGVVRKDPEVVRKDESYGDMVPPLRKKSIEADVPASPNFAMTAKAADQAAVLKNEIAPAPLIAESRMEEQPSRSLDHFVRAKPAAGLAGASTTVEVSSEAIAVEAPAAAIGSGVASMQKSVAVPSWRIASNDSLQRSLDQGSTWRDITIVPDITMGGNSRAGSNSVSSAPVPQAYPRPAIRALYTSGAEVWAGGAGGALFHTLDSGAHWMRVVPASPGVALTGDIVKITFDDSLHGSVATSTLQVWTTSDGGQSWGER